MRMHQRSRRSDEPRGEALVAELKWVHDMIRRDLRTVRRLAEDVARGADGERIRADLRSLARNGPLWQLKVNCLQYCRFVHSHHTGESATIFPALRRSNPALNPVVDRLEADHARVADLLDQVDGAARSLGGDDDGRARARLAEALGTLAVDLLEHLRYEEEQISDTLRTWTGWPHETGRRPR